MRIRLIWSALAVVAAVTAAWFRTGRRRWPSSNPDRCHTVHDEGGGLANDQIDPAGDDPSSGPDEPQRGPKPLTQEDLPAWKAAIRIWGSLGLLAAGAAYSLGIWLGGEHDDHLLRLVTLLVGPCAVLISVSIVAITFTGDWEITTSSQSKRREDLFFHSRLLICVTVPAIALAGVYVAVAPVSDGSAVSDESALLNADIVQVIGGVATWLLALSLFGVIIQVLRIVILVKHQRPGPNDVPLTGEHQNSHNDARA